MASDQGVESSQPQITREEKVAERWLKLHSVEKSEATNPLEGNVQDLVGEVYDLFVEKDDLKRDIVRKQKQTGEDLAPKSGGTKEESYSLEQKTQLIQQGRVDLLMVTGSDGENLFNKSLKEITDKSHGRINEIDERVDSIFKTEGVYDKVKEDLSHQVRIRHEAREVQRLNRFLEQIDITTLKLARESQVSGRDLNSSEKNTIKENQGLKAVINERISTLLSDREVAARLRILELKEYKKQLGKDRFAETPSRQEYLRRIQEAWAEGKRVLLSGETGTGKTELVKHASDELFGTIPEYVTGHQDLSIYELLGKTGFNIAVGDVYRPAPLVRAMTGREGKGQPFLFDEIDRAPNQAIMGIKTLLNVRPGQSGVKVQTDSNSSIDVGSDYAVSATANIKSDKYTTATELDPAIVRVFDAPITIDYMPPHEVYDLAIATLMDKKGNVPLTGSEARNVLKNLCDAAYWIQLAYQGKRIVTNPAGTEYLKARGGASKGEVASLKKALLDPGRTLDMLNGWHAASAKGVDFQTFMSERVMEFINNRSYPEEDRYYLTEIFAIKGFLQGRNVSELMVSDLDQKTLNAWNGAK